MSAEGREPGELMDEIERWIEAEMHRLDPDAYQHSSIKTTANSY